MSKLDEKRIKELLRKEAKLEALESGGVDNWEWYDESLKEYRKTVEREEDCEALMDDIMETLGWDAYEPSERGAGVAFSDTAIKSATELLLKFLNEKLAEANQ